MPACDGCFSFSAAFRKGSPLDHWPPTTGGNFAAVSAGVRLRSEAHVKAWTDVVSAGQLRQCSNTVKQGRM